MTSWPATPTNGLQRILTDPDPTQRRLYYLFGLDTYAPHS